MSFDAQSFLDATTTDSNATSMEPIPEGEYQAVISEVDVASGVSQKNGEPWTRLDVKVEVQDPILGKAHAALSPRWVLCSTQRRLAASLLAPVVMSPLAASVKPSTSNTGKLSVASPMARALIGKYAGDVAQVQAPGGIRDFEVIDVRYE